MYKMISLLKSKLRLGPIIWAVFDHSTTAPITLFKENLCCWGMATKNSDPISLISLLEAQFHIKLMIQHSRTRYPLDDSRPTNLLREYKLI